jgi:hypothetical protein
MDFLKTNNSTLNEIVTVAERLDNSAQKALLSNIKKFEITLKAQRLDASVKRGKKPSLIEIAAAVRKVRKANAKEKVR